MNDVSRELGGAIGIAVLGSAFTASYRASIDASGGSLPTGTVDSVRDSAAADDLLGWADPLSANLDEAGDGVGDVVGSTSKAVASFEDDDVESVSCELLGGSEPGHAGTDDDDLGVLLFGHWFASRKSVVDRVILRSLTSSSFRLPWIFGRRFGSRCRT